MNLTEEDLLYKGGHRKPEDRTARNGPGQQRGDTIEQRPEEINNRDTFGNWEMDRVMGCKGSKAALVVLTERLTNYPRRILDWKTPQMLFDEYMTVAA